MPGSAFVGSQKSFRKCFMQCTSLESGTATHAATAPPHLDNQEGREGGKNREAVGDMREQHVRLRPELLQLVDCNLDELVVAWR
eukprot:11955970-Karenia_brevis.AAC.1